MANFFKQHIRGIRYFTTAVSILLIVISVTALVWRGLNFGLDFTGGMVSEVKVDTSLSNTDLLQVLRPALGKATAVTQVSEAGHWSIRYPIPANPAKAVDIAGVLSKVSHHVTLLSSSMVGSEVGQDLIDQGGIALLVSVLCILGYLCFRFEWRLATGSLLALAHDVILVLGLFAITQMEFDLTVFAAILAILGYSLNDSIIISDRIRELLIAHQEQKTAQVNDEAIIATFSRTMVTSGTTLITIASLWILGGDALTGFSVAMFIGVLSGTWSSISIGTVVPQWFKLQPRHYLPPEIDTAP